MNRKHLVSRTLRIGTCGTAILLSAVSTASVAAPAKELDSRSCASTYQKAQAQQQSGQLVEASKLFDQCANIACDEAVWSECAAKERQLHSQLSSVVPVVTDDAGEPLTDVQVLMDGKVLTSKLDGRALTIVPGVHVISFRLSQTTFASEKVTVGMGEHNRLISVLLPAGPVSLSE